MYAEVERRILKGGGSPILYQVVKSGVGVGRCDTNETSVYRRHFNTIRNVVLYVVGCSRTEQADGVLETFECCGFWLHLPLCL